MNYEQYYNRTLARLRDEGYGFKMKDIHKAIVNECWLDNMSVPFAVAALVKQYRERDMYGL